MKRRFLLLLTALGLMLGVQKSLAQYMTIPDPNFVTWLQNNGYETCMIGNQLDTTCPMVLATTTIACNYNNISDLTGLEAFDNLIELYCDNNQLTSLPPLPASLGSLYCGINQLTTLPPLPSSLTILDCGYNQLTALPPLPSSLESLWCDHNQITSLPPLPAVLGSLVIHGNPGISCLPPLAAFTATGSFNVSGTGIGCLPNVIQHAGYIAAIDTMPICDVINANDCEVGWNILGTVFKDDDSDCSFDTAESALKNVKVLVMQGDSVIN